MKRIVIWAILLTVLLLYKHESYSLIYAGENGTCPDCSGTNKVNCAICFGTGLKISKCNICAGIGICPSCKNSEYVGYVICTECKGKGKNVCQRCNGKGTITTTSFGSIGKKGMQTEEVQCPDCQGQGERECQKCKGKIIIICNTCKGSGMCLNCFGTGIVRDKGKCGNCKGTGKVDCQLCKSEGKTNNVRVLTLKNIEDEISKMNNSLQDATDIQKKNLMQSFIADWDKKFSGRIVKGQGDLVNVETVKGNAPGNYVEKVELAIALTVTDGFDTYVLSLRWEKPLLKISKGDNITFLIVVPPLIVVTSLNGQDSLTPKYVLPYQSRGHGVLGIHPLYYRQKGGDETKEIELPAK